MATVNSGDIADLARRGNQLVSGSNAESWGWLPLLSLVGALGLLLVALANNGAREGMSWAMPLFWGGLLLLYGPIAARLVSPSASRLERMGLVTVLGLGLYLAKVLHSPIYFTFVDEFQHWRVADDIVQSGRLFQPNPILPISPFFPALEIVTTALTCVAGWTFFDAGIVVLGAARLVFVLTLYLFYEEISRSAQIAGVASLLYMSNPSFVFFDAVFAYESLALPFAVLALLVTARREHAHISERAGLTVAALICIGTVTVTHHLTTYALMAFLALWTLAPYTSREIDQPGPMGTTLLALVIGLTWLVYVASLTVDYLARPLQLATRDLAWLIAGEATTRQFFLSGGQMAPLWEQLTAYASVGLILLGLPFGLLQIWRRHRANAVALALAGGTLAYPLTLAFRMTHGLMLLSVRATPFLFVAITFVLAIGVVELWPSRLSAWGRAAIFTVWAAIIFSGGVVLGWPALMRLPGPYLVSSHTRSAEPQSIAAAEWSRDHLGPHNRMVADWVNNLLMGSFGRQDVVTGTNDKVNVAPVFFSTAIGPAEQAILQSVQIRYVVVDRRLSSGLPVAGWYFENGELGTFRHTRPIDAARLEKFEGLEGVSRLFDSGDIVIYDVGVLTNAP